MRVVDLIELKKNGKELNEQQLSFLIKGYIKQEIPDYQMAAFLMAIFFKGMTSEEIVILTKLMMNSGEVYDLSEISELTVDKHSTGGVGDKVSLVLGPILAACGACVVKMSGRGLGHTGGTIDKLDSISGFNVTLTKEQLFKQAKEIKMVIIGQSEKIDPADKMLYALRDVTATVDSIPLIASSIMSKKLATGSKSILLDVKCGDGAFMKNLHDARLLAKTMVEIGNKLGKNVRAEITNMNQPLGRAIGNKIEVLEAISSLQGNYSDDFKEIIESSGASLLVQSKIVETKIQGVNLIRKVVQNGEALEIFKKFIKYQGGNLNILFSEDFWKPKYSLEVKSQKNGFMKIISAIDFGLAAMKLGAGRETKESKLDYDAGIFLNKKSGEKVQNGDVIFTLYSSKKINDEIILDLEKSYEISNERIIPKIILDTL